MPQVLKTLEAVICWSEMRRDFMPRGSEQPAVLKYTVTQWFTQAVKRKESVAPSQAKPRSPSRRHPHLPTAQGSRQGQAGRGLAEEGLGGKGLAEQGLGGKGLAEVPRYSQSLSRWIFSSQLFPGSQCLLLQAPE